MIETDTSELRLNVTSFNKNQETQNLLLAEEGSLITNDCEHKFGGDHIYKCIVCSLIWKISRSTLLALLLFIVISVLVIFIALLCAFIFFSEPVEIQDDVTTDDVLGVINWLHYPIGDVAFRHTNSFSTHKSSITNV